MYYNVMGAAIDTLQIYERLKAAKLNEEAAKQISEVFKDVIENNLATKADLNNLATKADVERSKVEVIKCVAGMLIAQAAIVATLVKLL